MVFNSLTFLVFFAIVLGVHSMPLPWVAKKSFLLVASYVFYAAWNPPFVVLLWISTLIDWTAAARLHAATTQAARRFWLVISLAANLGILGYFKYGEFLLQNWQQLMAAFGVEWVPPAWDIILPVGISFYTFQTMAYTLDIYLRRAEPQRSFLDFALFVTFFPQLVAGPIVRPTELIPQFAAPRTATRDQLLWGLALIVIGLFEKVVLADGLLAGPSDDVFGAGKPLPPLDAWAGLLAFSGQIFFDFAGYSTIAIGTALCLGFHLPNNFRYPYGAIGFSDFWRRWHISLSSWLRDYLYVPLGGNRLGPSRTYVNLMVTMLLGGLWHGASWTFVVWGGLHGLYLAAERSLRQRFSTWSPGLAARVALALLTYALINLTWVFFRAEDFPSAWLMLASLVGVHAGAAALLNTIHLVEVGIVISALVTTHYLMRERTLESVVARLPAWLVGVALAAMLFLLAVTQGGGNAFIYFQF